MQSNYHRFLAPLFAKAKEEASLDASKKMMLQSHSDVAIPSEFTPKDYLSFLLHVDAELEHGLMLQYLYGAYSMGGEHITDQKIKEKVKNWQEIILGIAKEEMGHFISIQNVLRLIGAPLNFGRQDYPWDTPFYPFPFKLEPLTKRSLAKYVYAESPPDWINSNEPTARQVKAILATEDHGDPISILFGEVEKLIKNQDLIPDDVFQGTTYPYQAKFDEWGRGYKAGQRGVNNPGKPKSIHVPGTPDVLVAPLTNRDDALSAIQEIGEQGEATSLDENSGLPSHFERFKLIFEELVAIQKELKDPLWKPSMNVAVNPYIPGGSEEDFNTNPPTTNPGSSPSEGQDSDERRDPITNPEAVKWAHLLNTRYRMLLTFLMHSFYLDDGFNRSGSYTPRATIINATFGEMYNIRSISNVLVQLPIGGKRNIHAGPPFLIPYSMDLPIGETDRWRLHKDILLASHSIIAELLEISDQKYHKYLIGLREADKNLLAIVNKLTTPK